MQRLGTPERTTLRIAIINRHPIDALGGSEIQCDNIATGLSHRGHSVVYIAPGGNVSQNYCRSYSVQPVNANGRSIADAVIGSRPDVAYWRLNRYMLLRAARQIAAHDIPFIFAISHIRDTQLLQHTSNYRSGMRNAARALKELLVNAYNYRGFAYVAAATSVNPDLLGRLPVDQQLHVPSCVNMAAQPFHWPRPYVVWIANLKASKRPELFVRLAETLKSSGVDFLMFGEVQADEYRGIAEGAPPNFHFLGPCTFEQSNGVIAGSLLLAHTCRPEGFPNNLIQAWLAGRPTVSLGFDPGGHIDREHLGGFAHDDFGTFVHLVGALIRDDAKRNAVGERARLFADANFSVDRTVSTLEGLLQAVVSRKASRG